MQWFKIDIGILNCSQDCIFGVVYIPPGGSLYSSSEAFDENEREFLEINVSHDNICLIGDFNARVADEDDYFEVNDFSDYEIHLDDIDIDYLSDIHNLDEMNISRKRKSIDKKKNNYGKYLLNFCKSNSMYILNGRLEKGDFTTVRSSVVDCCICSAEMLKHVKNFQVLDFCSLYSDIHLPLSCEFGRKQ